MVFLVFHVAVRRDESRLYQGVMSDLALAFSFYPKEWGLKTLQESGTLQEL